MPIGTADLGIDPVTAADFVAARAAAQAFLAALPGKLQGLSGEQQQLREQGWPAQARRADLIAEQDSLTGRTGRVPRRLHEARLAIAAAADIDPAELPFVAELIDVAPGEQAWRKAAEVTLYSIARVLLVEDSRLQQLSRAIDPVRLPVRVQFEGVAHRPHADEPGDPRYVSGKLLYKESPFSWWIRQRVTRRGTDHLCVESPDRPRRRRAARHQQRADAKRPPRRARRPRRLVHHRLLRRRPARRDHNRDRRTRRRPGRPPAPRTRTRRPGAAAAPARERTQVGAGHRVGQTSTSMSAETHLTSKQDELSRLLAANDVLAALDEEHSRLEDANCPKRRPSRSVRRMHSAPLRTTMPQLCEQQDETTLAIDRIDADGTVTLLDDQADYLDTVFVEVGSLDSLADFDRSLPKLRARLADRTSTRPGESRPERPPP